MHTTSVGNDLHVYNRACGAELHIEFWILLFPQWAAGGLNGLMDPVEPGLACGSDTAHLSILGYEPRRWVDFEILET